MVDKPKLGRTFSVDLVNYDDEFFTTDVDGLRRGLIDKLKSENKLEDLINLLGERYFSLKDSHKAEKGKQTNFPCVWNKWLREYSFGEFAKDFGIFDCGETEVALTVYWIASKVANENEKLKRVKEIALLIANQPPNQQIRTTFLKKPIRNIKTDQLYSLCRLGGGCLGEIWKMNKENIKIYQKIIKNKKPLTQHQRDKAHKLYQISLSLRNMDQFPEDIPSALIQINKGGLLIPHVSLMEYVKEISYLVVAEWTKGHLNSDFPKNVLKETMASLKTNKEMEEIFHQAVGNIPEVVSRGFKLEDLEEFRQVWQRKLGDAKLGDLFRQKVQKRNDRKGKRGIGGQNLRCYLYRNTVKKTISKRKLQGDKTVPKLCVPTRKVRSDKGIPRKRNVQSNSPIKTKRRKIIVGKKLCLD